MVCVYLPVFFGHGAGITLFVMLVSLCMCVYSVQIIGIVVTLVLFHPHHHNNHPNRHHPFAEKNHLDGIAICSATHLFTPTTHYDPWDQQHYTKLSDFQIFLIIVIF